MSGKRQPAALTVLWSAYDACSSMDESYRHYCNDPTAQLEQDGRRYYKILQLLLLHSGHKKRFLCAIDTALSMKLHDTLTNERGNHYTVEGFEQPRMAGSTPPAWFGRLIFITISGDISAIGEYLTLL